MPPAAPDHRIAIVPVTQFQQNCSIVWQPATMRGAVIDPGGEPGLIVQTLSRLGVSAEAILLTHGHLDHAGGALALKYLLDQAHHERGEPPVPVIGPDERDRFLLDGIEEQQKLFNMGGLRNITPDRWLVEGDVVDVAGLHFDVYHVPGHSPGSVVFVEAARRFAFVGDVLFRNGIGRHDFPYGNGDQLVAGIKTKLLPLGDDIAFVCGHGPSSTFGAERLGNIFVKD